jgi:hypothetical protein
MLDPIRSVSDDGKEPARCATWGQMGHQRRRQPEPYFSSRYAGGGDRNGRTTYPADKRANSCYMVRMVKSGRATAMGRIRTRAEGAAPPTWIKPQLAALVKKAPDGPEWLNELSFGGRARRLREGKDYPADKAQCDSGRNQPPARWTFDCQRNHLSAEMTW